MARIYVGNTPIRLEIAKVKQEETEILFELSDRREGTLTELSNRYGLENLELAYNASGTFLGYGWSKGWLDSLRAKQEAGEWIDLIYEDQVFTGKAIWHRVPDTAHALNRYLPGASMCLYDAIEVKKNGDSEDPGVCRCQCGARFVWKCDPDVCAERLCGKPASVCEG